MTDQPPTNNPLSHNPLFAAVGGSVRVRTPGFDLCQQKGANYDLGSGFVWRDLTYVHAPGSVLDESYRCFNYRRCVYQYRNERYLFVTTSRREHLGPVCPVTGDNPLKTPPPRRLLRKENPPTDNHSRVG